MSGSIQNGFLNLIPKSVLKDFAKIQEKHLLPSLGGLWHRNYIIDNVKKGKDDTTNVYYLQTPMQYYSDFRIPKNIVSKYYFNTQNIKHDWYDYNADELIELSQNILADFGKLEFNYTEINQNDSEFSNIKKYKPYNDICENNKNKQKTMKVKIPTARWHSILNYQAFNVYPEPGYLFKHETLNNAMYEQPPSNEYLELWQLQTNSKGPFIVLANFDFQNIN